MIYYGIVERVKDEHKSGIYGRKKPSKEEIKTFYSITQEYLESFFFVSPAIGAGAKLMKWINQKDIILQKEDTSAGKKLVFWDRLLDGSYSVSKNKDLLYGLFDNYPPIERAFKTIMKSYGGASLIIKDRDSISKSKQHVGGIHGKFTPGLYCSHPKDQNILIPLYNSIEYIKTLILEETIRAYMAVGAKRILIEDITIHEGNAGASYKGIKAEASVKHNKEELRKETFGPEIFNPEKALSENLLIHDIPDVITTIKGRKEANQLNKKFKTKVDLGIGLNIGVLELFNPKVNYKYERIWSFEVEFYDKNDPDFKKHKFQVDIDSLNQAEKELLEKYKVIYEDRKKSRNERFEIEDFCLKNNISSKRANEIEGLVLGMFERKQSLFSSIWTFFSKLFGG